MHKQDLQIKKLYVNTNPKVKKWRDLKSNSLFVGRDTEKPIKMESSCSLRNLGRRAIPEGKGIPSRNTSEAMHQNRPLLPPLVDKIQARV